MYKQFSFGCVHLHTAFIFATSHNVCIMHGATILKPLLCRTIHLAQSIPNRTKLPSEALKNSRHYQFPRA